MKEETQQSATTCGSCKKEIKGAQYKLKIGEKNVWACERCYEKAE